MARKSLERTLMDWLFGTVGIVLIALALLIMLLREYPLQIMAVVAAAFGARHYLKKRGHNRRLADLHRAVDYTDNQIQRHQTTLIAYYRQSIRRDHFGNEDTRVWDKWLETFLANQVLPGLNRSGIELDDDSLTRLVEHVDNKVRHVATTELLIGSPALDAEKLDPQEYEHECAAILFRRGWTVHPTPSTGDHGADVIAEKGGVRLIVQCKLYSQPVGNKAVQEAYSACGLYNGTNACVVAPRGFTAQAEREAHGLGVRLLHHSQLETFADNLSAGATAKRAIGNLDFSQCGTLGTAPTPD